MSMRHLIYNVLSATAGIQQVYSERIIDAGQLGDTEGQPPEFPYLAVKYGERLPGPNRTSFVVEVEFWSYDDPYDYSRTEKGLDAIFDALDNRAGGSATVDGVTTHLIEAHWLTTSRDFTDDALRASAKYATYRLVGNRQ